MPPPSKRRKTSVVQEVVFDPVARHEYLTGFHKRKLARIKHAQEIALKKEKEEKRRERIELRRQRQQQLEDHVKAINDSMKILNGTGDESGEDDDKDDDRDTERDDSWGGFDVEAPVESKDEEYVDEDQYATVTVEAVEITRDGMEAYKGSEQETESSEEESSQESGTRAEAVAPEKKTKRLWSKNKLVSEKPKRKKSRNFRYESKEVRKLNRARERAKRKAHALSRKSRK
ncbi:uncharacterized protein PV09_05561 [Verruconis gallopava]|uniref:Ribosomal RNA-processing protein 17 n=1 Tax=Verruconis gallopava TaxID=253628 RepID=A0A0D2A9B6_9PEZI|nr:uncharacterized protein PV09_05561 [Verruconis gallopava]KIW03353.1 hypothetical protein PV09_05561 [Verruconis gallopava]